MPEFKIQSLAVSIIGRCWKHFEARLAMADGKCENAVCVRAVKLINLTLGRRRYCYWCASILTQVPSMRNHQWQTLTRCAIHLCYFFMHRLAVHDAYPQLHSRCRFRIEGAAANVIHAFMREVRVRMKLYKMWRDIERLVQ